jgi:uncharacterized protein (UPF0333 family)
VLGHSLQHLHSLRILHNMKLLTPILLLIIAVAVFFTVVEPLRASVSGVSSDITAYNVALDNSAQLEKTQARLLDVYKNIKLDDKSRLEHLLPNTVDNIKFILEIERIASQYNMPIKNIKFDSPVVASSTARPVGAGNTNTVVISGEPKGSKSYGSFSIDFDTEGSYSSFLLFLKDLERNLRLVTIKSIQFSVPTGKVQGSSTDSYSYSFKVETYWLK